MQINNQKGMGGVYLSQIEGYNLGDKTLRMLRELCNMLG